MLSQKPNALYTGVALFTSLFVSDRLDATQPVQDLPAAHASSNPGVEDRDALITRILGDEDNKHRRRSLSELLDAGVSPEAATVIPLDRLSSYQRALSYTSAERINFVAQSAHSFGQENAWHGADTWIEQLEGVDQAGVDQLLKLRELREPHIAREETALNANRLSTWHELIKGGVPLQVLAEMDSGDAADIAKGFRNGRFPVELFAFISGQAPEEYSRISAEADQDFSKGVEVARRYVLEQLAAREHIERPSTDYTEGAEQFLAIEDPHQVFLIKQYVQYFTEPNTIIQLNSLFPVVPEEDKEEEGGIIVARARGIESIHIPQYTKESDKRGDERNAFKTPELCEFMDHLGVLHTHPGGRAFAGPSGYSKPSYGPGKYYPHGDTYSLAEANDRNPRLIEVVVTEISTGKINIDLFCRDVQIKEDGSVINTDPVRVIDLGVFELPPEEMAAKLALKAELDKTSAQKVEPERQQTFTAPTVETPRPVVTGPEPSAETEVRAYVERAVVSMDQWGESVIERTVCGDELKRRFEALQSLREITEVTAPDFLEMLSIGVQPEQLVDVHRYHIAGLAEGFRNGRYPERFIPDLGKSHVRYSAEAAVNDPDASKGSLWAKELIRERLQERDHLFRLDTDYDEGISALDATTDKYILFIIKRYQEFFNDPDNWDGLVNLFRDAGADLPSDSHLHAQVLPTPERGGMLLCRDNRIVFEEILQSIERRTRPDAAANGYSPPHIQYYGVALGGLHTHPLDLNQDPRHSGELASVSGPSGKAITDNAEDRFVADTGSLRYFNRGHPFALDVVITELGNDQYNVDIYYRDITEENGKAVNARNVTVLDLGIFEPAGEKAALKGQAP